MDIIQKLQTLKVELQDYNKGGEKDIIKAIDELVAKLTLYVE